MNQLGRAKRLVVDKDQATIIGDAGAIKDPAAGIQSFCPGTCGDKWSASCSAAQIVQYFFLQAFASVSFHERISTQMLRLY